MLIVLITMLFVLGSVHKGTDKYVHWIDYNKPLMTGASFLDMLKKTFM